MNISKMNAKLNKVVHNAIRFKPLDTKGRRIRAQRSTLHDYKQTNNYLVTYVAVTPTLYEAYRVSATQPLLRVTVPRYMPPTAQHALVVMCDDQPMLVGHIEAFEYSDREVTPTMEKDGLEWKMARSVYDPDESDKLNEIYGLCREACAPRRYVNMNYDCSKPILDHNNKLTADAESLTYLNWFSVDLDFHNIDTVAEVYTLSAGFVASMRRLLRKASSVQHSSRSRAWFYLDWKNADDDELYKQAQEVGITLEKPHLLVYREAMVVFLASTHGTQFDMYTDKVTANADIQGIELSYYAMKPEMRSVVLPRTTNLAKLIELGDPEVTTEFINRCKDLIPHQEVGSVNFIATEERGGRSSLYLVKRER